MYSTHKERKSVIVERFIKTLKAKIYKRMTANDSKSHLPCLNKLVDQYNNTYHYSINEKPINVDYTTLTKNIETNRKAPKFKVNNRVRTTKYKNVVRVTENWSREMFIINSILKTNPWTYRIKDLNGERIIGGFYEKKLLQRIL